MAQKKTGALDRAVRFFNELSNKTLTRTEMKNLAKEFGVRNGLEKFALERGWCKKIAGLREPNQMGPTPATIEFSDLSQLSPLHIRLLLDDANAYMMECKAKRNQEKQTTKAVNVVATAEFEWTAETTKMFAKVYSGNFRSLPSRFNYKTYHGLSMDEKVKQFMSDFVRPETQQVTVSVVETYTRTLSRTIEVPGDVDIQDYLAMNPHLSDFEEMPKLEGTPFTDTTTLTKASEEFRYENENGVGGTL